VVVRVDTHNLSVVVTFLARHVGDCDGEGLRGHTSEYATRPMAKMSCSNGDGFCLDFVAQEELTGKSKEWRSRSITIEIDEISFEDG
jgi:hypothetical protein